MAKMLQLWRYAGITNVQNVGLMHATEFWTHTCVTDETTCQFRNLHDDRVSDVRIRYQSHIVIVADILRFILNQSTHEEGWLDTR